MINARFTAAIMADFAQVLLHNLDHRHDCDVMYTNMLLLKTADLLPFVFHIMRISVESAVSARCTYK